MAKLALAISGDNLQAARLSDREHVIWNEIRPALVTLFGNGKATGVAALVDDSGYFVADTASVVGVQPFGTTSTGKQLSFNVVCQDKTTMLALLKTNAWEAGSARPFHAPVAGEAAGGPLIAALPSGPLRMGYGTGHTLGVLKPSRRLVPLTEVRFEATSQFVGGALIFSESGNLIGSLIATLDRQDDAANRQLNNAGGGNFAGGGQLGGGQGGRGGGQGGGQVDANLGSSGFRAQYANTGPSEMTIGYTVNTELMRHVLDGFLSPNHSVEYAVLGIFCRDAIGGGAQIQSVTAGSPADKSGLRPGDILVNIASNPIADQVAFAAVMLQQKVGKRIPLVVQRGQGKLLIDIVPAKAAD